MISDLWPLVALAWGLLAYRASVSIFSKRRVSHEEFEEEMGATGETVKALKEAMNLEVSARVSGSEELRMMLGLLESKIVEMEHTLKRLDARIAAPVKRLG